MPSFFSRKNEATRPPESEPATPRFTHALPQQTGTPGDAHEQEANAVAENMFGPLPDATKQPVPGATGRHAAPDENLATRGGGQPLPNAVRTAMEPALNRDFSNVQVHTGAEAEQVTARANAHALTHDNHIFYSKGQQPGVNALTAHELAHVAQQSAPPTNKTSQTGTRSKVTGSGNKGVQHSESPGKMRACAGTPWTPRLGRTTTTLPSVFGSYTVTHGLDAAPTASAFGEYYCQITMTPNMFLAGRRLSFMQAIRRGTTAGKWSTGATDIGMDADRAKRTTADGWKLDRADPAGDKTPFYGQKKSNIMGMDVVYNLSNSQTGEYGGADAMLVDTPGVIDQSVMEFSSTLMDKDSGMHFGTVAWGMTYDSTAHVYTEETPRLIDQNSDRAKGQDAAFQKWNTAVATPGSGIDKVPGI